MATGSGVNYQKSLLIVAIDGAAVASRFFNFWFGSSILTKQVISSKIVMNLTKACQTFKT
jgi:hypothetical protein